MRRYNEAIKADLSRRMSPPHRQQGPAEAHQLLPLSTQNTSIAELAIQRSGFIVDERSYAISFQGVII